MPRLRPLTALLLALLFLAAQQAAFAHLMGHIGAPGASGAILVEADHVAADNLTDVCTTCIALAALSGSAPVPAPHAAPAAGVTDGPLPALPFAAFPAAASASYLARAPPVVS